MRPWSAEVLRHLLKKGLSSWDDTDRIMYQAYISGGVFNEISIDGTTPMIEPVWSIQKDQRDKRFTAAEHTRYVKYLQYVKEAMKYIKQETETQRECYDTCMRKALNELKLMYVSDPVNVYTFSQGKHHFRMEVPGVPVYVTESNYCSDYLSISGHEYFVFWKHFGRYNVAYVKDEIRDEFSPICAMLAYDFTCQVRSTLADFVLAYTPHNPPDKILTPHHPMRAWFESKDGLKNSGVRQLVREDEVVIDRTSLTLMYPGLNRNVYTYAHKIGSMMWLHSSEDARTLFIWSGLYQSTTREHWVETAKQISLALKPIMRVAPRRISALVEADSLANRHEEDELDWEEEKRIRSTPVDNLIPVSYIYQTAYNIFRTKRANGIVPHRQCMDDYIMELPMTIPEGAWFEPMHKRSNRLRSFLSTHGMSDNVAGSKAIHILNCHPATIKALLRKDHVDVNTQIKVEWSKLRALYPTDVASNLQCAYVAGEVEKYLPNNCLIGAGYSDERVASLISAYERTGFGISAGQDYKGFNEQHKRESMKAVMDAWLDVYRSNLHPEQIQTMELIRANFDRHYIQFPDGKTIHLEDTLMSGSRWTTFLNTMFNHIYSKFIHLAAGVNAITFHVGDDVYGRYRSLADAEKVIYVANRLNVHMQVQKCFVYGSSEFLRKQYIGETHFQYLCRSIATLVHSRWERDEPIRLKDRLNGLYTRMLNFLERGGSFVAVNWAKMLDRIAAAKLGDVKTQYMLSLPSEQGGVRSCVGNDHAWVRLLKYLGIYRQNEDAFIIEDQVATRPLYRAIEQLPLIGYSAARILWVSNLSMALIDKMKAFLSHRFSASTKFDNTRLVIDRQARCNGSLARYVDQTAMLDYTYSRIHPYVRAMYAARRRGAMRRWFLSQLR